MDVLVLQAAMMATSNTQLLLLLLLLPAQARPATLFVTSHNCNLCQVAATHVQSWIQTNVHRVVQCLTATCLEFACVRDQTIHHRATQSWPLMLQMTTTMGMATTTTMSTGVATTVTATATSTTAAPLQLLLPLLQVVALQLQLQLLADQQHVGTRPMT